MCRIRLYIFATRRHSLAEVSCSITAVWVRPVPWLPLPPTRTYIVVAPTVLSQRFSLLWRPSPNRPVVCRNELSGFCSAHLLPSWFLQVGLAIRQAKLPAHLYKGICFLAVIVIFSVYIGSFSSPYHHRSNSMNGNHEFYSYNKLYIFPCYTSYIVLWRGKSEKKE